MRESPHLGFVRLQSFQLLGERRGNVDKTVGIERGGRGRRPPLGRRDRLEKHQLADGILRLRPAGGDDRVMDDAVVDIDVSA